MAMRGLVTLIGPMLLIMTCGCGGYINSICNLSLGLAKGVVLNRNLNGCAYPGLVTLPDGNLLAAFSCFGVIVTHLSSDHGATWSASEYVADNGTVVSLSLLPNGKLLLTTSIATPSENGTPTYFTGTIGSNDEIRWSDPVRISTPAWMNGCWAVSPVVSLANGSMLWPVWCFTDSTRSTGSSTVLLSSDGGVTWPTQITVGDAIAYGKDFDESAAVVYPSGEVVMIIRHTLPGETDIFGSWWRSISYDNGNTWSKPVQVANSGLVGRPALALLPSGGLILLSRSNRPGIPTTGYATSWNKGLKFSHFSDLGAAGRGTADLYNALTLRPGGTIGVLTVFTNSDRETNNAEYRELVSNCAVNESTP